MTVLVVPRGAMAASRLVELLMILSGLWGGGTAGSECCPTTSAGGDAEADSGAGAGG